MQKSNKLNLFFQALSRSFHVRQYSQKLQKSRGAHSYYIDMYNISLALVPFPLFKLLHSLLSAHLSFSSSSNNIRVLIIRLKNILFARTSYSKLNYMQFIVWQKEFSKSLVLGVHKTYKTIQNKKLKLAQYVIKTKDQCSSSHLKEL